MAHHTVTLKHRLTGLETASAQPVDDSLEGRADVEVDGLDKDMVLGDCCSIFAGWPHAFTAVGDVAVKLLVIYSPPDDEDPSKTL